MKRNKIKRIILIALLGISFLTISKFGLKAFTKPSNNYNISSIQSINNNRKIDSVTILEELKETGRIEIMQGFTSKEIEIKNGIADNVIFKNNKYINFKGLGHYYIDLQNLKDNQVQVNEDKREVTIFLSSPILELELLEDKTEFKTEQGILIFNNFKMELEEYEKLKQDIKIDIIKKLSEEDCIKEVNEKTEKIINETVIKLVKSGYNINIRFV